MPNKCYYCGEIKLCRKYILLDFLPFLNIPSYICKDCDEYLNLQLELEEKRIEKNIKEKQKEFIKERDKFLKKARGKSKE